MAMDMVSSTSCSLLREKPDRMHASNNRSRLNINKLLQSRVCFSFTIHPIISLDFFYVWNFALIFLFCYILNDSYIL